eukprot:gene20731-26879_t
MALQVKNRAPAPIQITAEQLLREANDRGLEEQPKAPKQFITDVEELKLYQQNKRKDFEDQLRRQRQKIGLWCKYGLWEALQKEFERSRSVFERAIEVDYRNHVIWLKYAEMEMKNKFINHARNLWERAITLLPRVDVFWFKYTYMEEMIGAINEARAVFERWMKWEPIDHSAKFEIRQKDLQSARKILGKGIGLCAKENIFKGYIEIELQLGEMDRCRSIYIKYIEKMPYNCMAWKNYAQLEINLGEIERARAIYEIAVTQTELDMPELIWKSYIDLEINEREFDRVRKLYERLLDKTAHVKVWISYAQFEYDLMVEEENDDSKLIYLENIRNIFNNGYKLLKDKGLKEERIILLEAWRDIEMKAPEKYSKTNEIEKKFPRKIKMKRPIVNELNDNEEFEEYYEYQFPDEETKIVGLKLLENAMKWKQNIASSKEEVDSEEATSSGIDISGVFVRSSTQSNSILGKRNLDSADNKYDNNEIDIDI